MGKSLQERIEDSEGKKDIASIIKKIENSYVLKGLNWVDKKLKLKEIYEESDKKYKKLLKYPSKGINFLRDFFLYGNIGLVLPTKKQEEYTKHLGYHKLKFTKYSIAYDLFLCGIRMTGALTPSAPITVGCIIWSLTALADAAVRTGYTLITKKPCGTFIYIETPLRIRKYLLKRKEKKLEAKSLNNNTTLHLS